jgi:hypothetical protein
MTQPAHLDSAHLCSPSLTRRGRPRPGRAPAPDSSTPDSPASQKNKKESGLDPAGTLAARQTQPADHRPLWPSVLLPQRQLALKHSIIYTLRPPPASSLARPPPRSPPLGPAPQKKRHLSTGHPVKRGCVSQPAGAPRALHPKNRASRSQSRTPPGDRAPPQGPGGLARPQRKASGLALAPKSQTLVVGPLRHAAARPPPPNPPFAPASNGGPLTSTKSAWLSCARSPCAPCCRACQVLSLHRRGARRPS